ncbi:hypothetical protein GJ633_08835 [Halorubrum sp. CBA1125]|uniref:hypothetical protein n=1 Tax=Halorubrum sp. CBA1125 TaxID=2668072 RepID=UPI0012E931FD|nr:hypothetical protein [Halorubrum sp. CBA1125]MUW14762.1 hypothetical protein [Halorubrum sp. CBA1125]
MPSTLPPVPIDGFDRMPTYPTNPAAFAVSVVFSFLIELAVVGILGAIVIAVAPTFTDEGTRYVRSDPVTAFVYGFGAYLAIVAATVLLAITLIGLVVVVPGLIALAIVSVATTTVGVVALGRWVGDALDVDVGGGLGAALLVGALAWSLLGLVPILGGLVTFALNAMGLGYLAARLLDDHYDDGDRVTTGSTGSPGTGRQDRRGNDGLSVHDGWTEGDDRDADRDDADRFRNLAALDQEREEREEREQQERRERRERPDDAPDSKGSESDGDDDVDRRDGS